MSMTYLSIYQAVCQLWSIYRWCIACFMNVSTLITSYSRIVEVAPFHICLVTACHSEHSIVYSLWATALSCVRFRASLELFVIPIEMTSR